MAFILSSRTRNLLCDAFVDSIDNGGQGTIEVYTGAQPDSPDDDPGQTLLAVLTFSAEAFGDAVDGFTTAHIITADTNVNATGNATWARIKDGAGNTIADLDIGLNSGTLSLDDISLVAGGTLQISSMTVTMPGS